MVDISGAWVWKNLVYVITQVNYKDKSRFVWRMINRHGRVSTGIGEQTGPDTVWVVWNCHRGYPAEISATHGKIIVDENGRATEIKWGHGISFFRSAQPE